MKESISVPAYVGTYIALMLLLALTAALAWVNIGPFSFAVALGIAVAKALLVLIIFMHLKVSSLPMRLTAALAFCWLGILFVLSLTDFLARNAFGIPGK